MGLLTMPSAPPLSPCPDAIGSALAEVPPVPGAAKPVDHEEIVRHWIRRLAAHFVGCPGKRQGVRRPRRRGIVFGSDEFLREISGLTGISLPKGLPSQAAGEKLLVRRLQERIRKGERRIGTMGILNTLHPDPGKSLKALGGVLGLNEVELGCLAFLLMLQTHEMLRAATGTLSTMVDNDASILVIAVILNLPVAKVREALSSQGRLALLVRWEQGERSLEDKFKWVSRGFAYEMLSPDFDPMKALRSSIVRAAQPTVPWENFSHLGEMRQVVMAYLGQAMASRRSGVNVLLYGGPGVGKTEFTRALAKELGCELFEVSTEDQEGDPIEPMGRLQALRLLSGFSAGKHCLLAFDECEDVFPAQHPMFGSASRQSKLKGWINRFLETNPSATLWLTNSVSGIDPAFVRRFDLVVEVRTPPVAVREAMLRNLSVTLPEAAISRLAACQELTPAIVSRAATVVSAIEKAVPGLEAPRVMELIMNHTLAAQGHAHIGAASVSAGIYDPAYLNCDSDPTALAEGVRRAQVARICFHGPPGTGKTALAVWIARKLGRPIHVKRGSDLFSYYVGQSEKNMAAAFRAASDEGAVLLVDEVDSFLQDRSRAVRLWEVTQTNEFLLQMEQFEGVFIATTNVIDGLDPAAMRRFDLKAGFGYLIPAQARSLLGAHLSAAGLAPATEEDRRSLDGLFNVTPGDFAAIARRNRFHPLDSARAWVEAVKAESRLKPGSCRSVVGFGAMANLS